MVAVASRLRSTPSGAKNSFRAAQKLKAHHPSPLSKKPPPPPKRATPLSTPRTKRALKSRQVWSLTKFYSVDFSQSRISVEKCIFKNAQSKFA